MFFCLQKTNSLGMISIGKRLKELNGIQTLKRIQQQKIQIKIIGQLKNQQKSSNQNMNLQKHKSIRLNPGVKRIQNYIFKFNDLLGKGNFSSVYKGSNELTNQTIAIKYIALSSLTCQRLKQLLDQQIQILTSLNHPNIVKCYEVLKSSHNCYIITELCDGGDLQGVLKRKHFLTEDQLIPYAQDIFQGLYYLSKKNIVHRDVKIANIFLSKGKAKIADFGFAQRAKKQFNDGKIGTPLCMSPQGFLQNLYGCKTDVWAFGIILYQLTHGRLPLQHCITQESLRKNIQIQLRIDQLRPQLSIELKDLILRCLDVNPCTRITFQQMKNTAFIRKITSAKMPPISLTDLKYIPSCHINHNSENQNQSFIVSLKNIELPQFSHLNKNQKILISKQNQHMNFAYGKNKICQDLKPQNLVLKVQKQQPCICKPPKLEIARTITYIPMVNENQLNQINKENNVQNNLFKQNEEYSITISHKSQSNLSSEQIDPFLKSQQKSLVSTTDNNDNLSVPNSPLTIPPFRRHKGSFQMTETQARKIQQFDKTPTRPISSRPSADFTEVAKVTMVNTVKKQKVPIDICPISNTKRLLTGFIKFNEAIGLIHYCRLIYKYICQLKSTGIYHVGDLNLRYYSNYLLNLLNQLVNKITSDHIILTKPSSQQDIKQNKLVKMKRVIQQYIERYKPNLQKQRADYLNRTTGQIKQISILDQRFIQTFFIPDKTKILNYNTKMVKFSQILQRCSRYQKYSQFDSNKELQELAKEGKQAKEQRQVKQQNKSRQMFSQKYPENIQNKKFELCHKIQNINKKVGFQIPQRKDSTNFN